MNDGDIDYSKYTLQELEEALSGIKPSQYPKNYANLCFAYKALTSTIPTTPSSETDTTTAEVERWEPKYDKSGRYIPNQIPSEDRRNYAIFSLLLFAYGSYGLWVNDIYIPGRRSRGVHLHDVPAEIMYGAMSCACLVILSVIIDHYDRRNNERYYRAFAEIGKFVGWALFCFSLFWGIFK
jgi:hypothetical protein